MPQRRPRSDRHHDGRRHGRAGGRPGPQPGGARPPRSRPGRAADGRGPDRPARGGARAPRPRARIDCAWSWGSAASATSPCSSCERRPRRASSPSTSIVRGWTSLRTSGPTTASSPGPTLGAGVVAANGGHRVDAVFDFVGSQESLDLAAERGAQRRRHRRHRRRRRPALDHRRDGRRQGARPGGHDRAHVRRDARRPRAGARARRSRACEHPHRGLRARRRRPAPWTTSTRGGSSGGPCSSRDVGRPRSCAEQLFEVTSVQNEDQTNVDEGGCVMASAIETDFLVVGGGSAGCVIAGTPERGSGHRGASPRGGAGLAIGAGAGRRCAA